MFFNDIRRQAIRHCLLPLLCCASTQMAVAGDRLIRHKSPDRGTYQPPVLNQDGIEPVQVETLDGAGNTAAKNGLVAAPVDDATLPPVDDAPSVEQADLPEPVVLSEQTNPGKSIQQVTYESAPSRSAIDAQASEPAVQTCSCESCRAGVATHATAGEVIIQGSPIFDLGCDAAPFCASDCCDGGCDSIGCGNTGWFGLHQNDWFGSIELLLMFRKGDRMPALASDGPLDDNTTQVFAGEETIFKDMTAGGRLTIGAWLDNCKDRHVVARGWFAGEETFGFVGDDNSHPTLVRPFLNVTDENNPISDTLIVVSPDEATGQLTIQGDSNVYGADISIRQLWHKRMGATVDFLYGYQYMGLDESLRISDRSTSLADVPPIGSVRATTDQFEVENDFHGGQFGIATNYREGCWSFSSLWKIGFGSVRRRALLTGSTLNSIDGNNAIDPNGLLVRSTNAGTRDDSTFGWVPELDLTIGWQRYPCFDVTFGYHIIAMTDALQVSGAIDPELAVNASADPSSNPRPMAIYKDGTFYVQGIHFGLSYIY